MAKKSKVSKKNAKKASTDLVELVIKQLKVAADAFQSLFSKTFLNLDLNKPQCIDF